MLAHSCKENNKLAEGNKKSVRWHYLIIRVGITYILMVKYQTTWCKITVSIAKEMAPHTGYKNHDGDGVRLPTWLKMTNIHSREKEVSWVQSPKFNCKKVIAYIICILKVKSEIRFKLDYSIKNIHSRNWEQVFKCQITGLIVKEEILYICTLKINIIRLDYSNWRMGIPSRSGKKNQNRITKGETKHTYPC